MAEFINYYLYSLVDRNCPNKLLVSLFLKSIKSISYKDWLVLEDTFKENINYLYARDEVMAYAIVSINLRSEFLGKDKEYTTELITAFITNNVCPQNYVKYTRIFLSEPIYSCIVKIVTNSKLFTYYNIFSTILDKLDNDLDSLIKALHNILNEEYHLLINNVSIKDIYDALYTYMVNENKKYITYTSKNFTTLLRLTTITKDSSIYEEVKRNLLKIENNSFTKREIVDKVLNYLEDSLSLRRIK